VCLNPGTTDPTNPSSELECNTQTGGAAPNDEGGPINEATVWSGQNLAISPSAGLFGQPTNATTGILAAGKVKYLNLDNCVYSNHVDDDYTTLVDSSNLGGAFDAGTNTSDSATATSCGGAGGGYFPNGLTVQNVDLLGQAWFNLAQCDYANSADNDNTTLFDQAESSPTNAANTASNPTNSTSVLPACPASSSGIPFDGANSGAESLDILDNRYVNLDQCDYFGAGTDNYTTGVDDVPNLNPAFDAGTNASNTAQTSLSCGPGGGGWVPVAANSGFSALDTLDTTRGQDEATPGP